MRLLPSKKKRPAEKECEICGLIAGGFGGAFEHT
jgi:hypothetical protein